MAEAEFYFATNYSRSNQQYYLFEFPDELIHSLKAGDTLTIKGRAEEEAYLCSNEHTYMIRKQETTNTLLVTQDSQILKSAFSVYCAIPTTPLLHQLRDLLYKSPYNLRDLSKLYIRKESGLYFNSDL